MTHEPRDRPRSLLARLRNLLRGMFAIWIRDSETQNPRAVYEQAIDERTRQYRQLKEAVAGILLHAATRLEAEITERRADDRAHPRRHTPCGAARPGRHLTPADRTEAESDGGAGAGRARARGRGAARPRRPR